MITSIDLDKRLKQLGWRVFHLAKLVSEIRAKRGTTTTASRVNSTIAKAIDNPAKSSLETLDDVVTALGGEINIVWDNRTGCTQTTNATGEQLYLVKFFEQAGVRVSSFSTLKGAISELLCKFNTNIRAEIWNGNECLWTTEDIQPTITAASYTVLVPDVLLPLDNRDWACCTK